ncbi:MAG: DUF5722 domain-containing protein, partial [Pseudomonadota bacterium]
MFRQIISVVFLLGSANAAFAQAVFCSSSNSDSDGDGWGWENNQSCLVIAAPAATQACVDTDGDGWGWADNRSCRVTAEVATTAVKDSVADTLCIDTDGDGWGWRNEQSCSVNTSSATHHLKPTNLSGRTPTPQPYPQRDPFLIKALQPDHWHDRNALIQANTAGVAVNLVWSDWQPDKSTAPCRTGEVTHQGYCYSVPRVFDNEIKQWSAAGLNVTGILWGVPAWARTDNCHTAASARDIFCTAKNPEDFARFAGMLAKRYNSGTNGTVHDFVIHNEVNMNDWYDDECGQGVAC